MVGTSAWIWCAVLLAAPPQEKGTFVLEQSGKKVGEEHFTVTWQDNRGVLESEITLTLPSATISMEIHQEVDPSLRPLSYKLTAETPGGTQVVTVEPTDSTLYEVLATVRGTHQSREFEVSDPVILDNNVLSHYVLIGTLLKDLKAQETRTAIVPQVMMTLPLKLYPGKATTFRAGEKTVEGKVYRLYLGDIEIELYEVEGRIVGGRIPSQQAKFYRTDLYPKGIEPIPAEGRIRKHPPPEVGEREIAFVSADGTRLAGSFSFPRSGHPPYPVVVMIHGSGGLDRDENAPGFETNIFRDLAWGFAQHGIASLRYDKRGTGRSQGDWQKASLEDLVQDAQAAVRFARRLPEAGAIFLLGHSEGGVIAPMVARRESVDGLILLEAPATPLDQIILYQIQVAAQNRHLPDSLVQEKLKETKAFFAFVRSSHGDWQDYPDSVVQAYPHSFSLRWWREHLAHDPVETLQKVHVPVLILQGDQDPQVPPEHATLLKQALEAGGNTDVELHVLEGMNHLLRKQEGPKQLLVQGLDQPLDDRVLPILISWIQKHSRS